jgi:hypothetical protein
VEWAELLAGVSACRELQELVLPHIVVEPLFPPGTAFGRLSHLDICDHEREHPPDAGVMGLWELVASGGLPALAKVKVRGKARSVSVEEVRSRVAPGLEAVAGTLMQFQLERIDENGENTDVLEAGYALGVAAGKLRRLKDLTLDLSEDGRLYHAFAQGLAAQGLAAGGGYTPLPLLWRVEVSSPVRVNAWLVASLLLPSVRVFGLNCCSYDSREALLAACSLHQAGYKHVLVLAHSTEEVEGTFRTVAPCTLGDSSNW